MFRHDKKISICVRRKFSYIYPSTIGKIAIFYDNKVQIKCIKYINLPPVCKGEAGPGFREGRKHTDQLEIKI